MEVELNDLQKQVDNQIEERLKRICFFEWNKAQIRKNGERYKNPQPVTFPQVVHDLLEYRQWLYGGVDPEVVYSVVMEPEVQRTYLNSK
jgi:hypothetical protein